MASLLHVMCLGMLLLFRRLIVRLVNRIHLPHEREGGALEM